MANVLLALGMLVAGTALLLTLRAPARLAARAATVQIGAGALWGIGDLALLALVERVGTGVGFTIAQLSLLVNVGIGIYVFKVPKPGSRAARTAQAGILLAGLGGGVIGALR